MPYTKHYNLPEMPTGAVEWPALFNDVVAKLEVGRTIKLIAGEALTARTPFYIKSDGKAWKATNATDVRGLWQSGSTGVGVEGFGQIGGVMTYASWTWAKGGFIYATAASALTQTVPSVDVRIVGVAISATEILILPISNPYNVIGGITLLALATGFSLAGGTTSKTLTVDETIAMSGKISHALATAANDFLVASGAGAFVKKTLAETRTILGLDGAITQTAVGGGTGNPVSWTTISEQQVLGRLTAGNIKGLTVTELTALINAATTALKGAVQLATDVEAAAKTATDKALVPSNIPSVMAAPGAIGGTTPAAITTTDLKATNDEADATLSGTPKLFLIKDNAGTQYYFKAYPTKT